MRGNDTLTSMKRKPSNFGNERIQGLFGFKKTIIHHSSLNFRLSSLITYHLKYPNSLVEGLFLWNPNVRKETQLSNAEKLASDREQKTIKPKWQE